MSNPIQTTGLSPSTVRTDKKPGESTSQWIKSHTDAVSKSTPSGNTLTTTWTCAGGARDVSSTRQPGESDGAFLLRHENAYLLDMVEYPPIP